MLTIAFFLATGRYLHYRRGVPLDGWTAYAVAVLNVFAVPSIHRGNDFLGATAPGRMPSPGVLLRRHQRCRARLPGMAIHDIGIAEPSTGRQEPTRPHQ